MIEQQAKVVMVDQGYAWVETERQSACGECGTKDSCGTATLSKAFSQKRIRVKAVNDVGAQVGDEVIVGLPENELVSGAFWVYIFPLLSLFAFAYVGDLITQKEGQSNEVAVFVSGMIGFVIGYMGARLRTKKREYLYVPVVLKNKSVVSMDPRAV